MTRCSMLCSSPRPASSSSLNAQECMSGMYHGVPSRTGEYKYMMDQQELARTIVVMHSESTLGNIELPNCTDLYGEMCSAPSITVKSLSQSSGGARLIVTPVCTIRKPTSIQPKQFHPRVLTECRVDCNFCGEIYLSASWLILPSIAIRGAAAFSSPSSSESSASTCSGAALAAFLPCAPRPAQVRIHLRALTII
jgi:hypothetical protein